MRTAGHAVVGGGLSEMTGGNFNDGFIGAGASAFISPAGAFMRGGEGSGLGMGNPFLGRTATAAVMGGTATAIGGGKFANGALTAGFMHVVNDEVRGVLEGFALDKAKAQFGLAQEMLLTSEAGQALYRVLDGTNVIINFVEEGSLPLNGIANAHYSRIGNKVTMNFTPNGISAGTLAHELHHISRQIYISNFGAHPNVIDAANDWILPVSHSGDRFHSNKSAIVESPAVRAENIVSYQIHKHFGGASSTFNPRSSYGDILVDPPYGRYKFSGEKPPFYGGYRN
jgi:hypothetical protein